LILLEIQLCMFAGIVWWRLLVVSIRWYWPGTAFSCTALVYYVSSWTSLRVKLDVKFCSLTFVFLHCSWSSGTSNSANWMGGWL